MHRNNIPLNCGFVYYVILQAKGNVLIQKSYLFVYYVHVYVYAKISHWQIRILANAYI